MILLRVAEFLWRMKEKRESISEQDLRDLTRAVQDSTLAMKMIDLRLKAIEASNSDLPKLKNDLRRVYTALKEISGDDWSRIRDEIMKDGFN